MSQEKGAPGKGAPKGSADDRNRQSVIDLDHPSAPSSPKSKMFPYWRYSANARRKQLRQISVPRLAILETGGGDG
jgi:hypothetical protein